MLVCCLLGFLPGKSQQSLPDFSVRELGRGKIQVSWNNPFPNCIQLAVQRSTDSLRDFRTIFSSLSPELPANGYVDTKQLPNPKRYYRIFYVLAGGAFYFSGVKGITPMPIDLPNADNSTKKNEFDSRKQQTTIYLKDKPLFTFSNEAYSHFRDSINQKTKDRLRRINTRAVEWIPIHADANTESNISIYRNNQLVAKLPAASYPAFRDSLSVNTRDTLFVINRWRVQLHPFIPDEKKYIFVYRNDSLVAKLDLYRNKAFRDSLSLKTKDSLFFIDNNRWTIHPYVPKYVWSPSPYIFTNRKGYVTIKLPLFKQHKYRIVFFDRDGSELFHLKTIKEPELVLDKTNFVHAGWFTFELYEDDKLKEKSKFLLQKE